MKLTMFAWVLVVLIGTYSFLQFQSVNQLREQVSADEEYSQILTSQINDSAQERLRLLNQITGLEEQLSVATDALLPVSDPTTEIHNGEPDLGIGDISRLDEERFIDLGNGEYLLNIPNEKSLETAWKTVEQIASSIERLDDELKLTTDKQEEEFLAVDLSAYGIFLEGIGLDEASRQNILAQLIDANREGFNRMLNQSVELQVNGYVAWVSNTKRVEEHFNFIAENSPAAVMGRTLDSKQLQEFYEYEADRLSQRSDSPDYIAELVHNLGL